MAAGVPEEWIAAHRYGGMLYVGHRCSWLHESDEALVIDRSFATSWDEPDYESKNGTRVLVFPGSFLLATFERAVLSFEQFCRTSKLEPGRPTRTN